MCDIVGDRRRWAAVRGSERRRTETDGGRRQASETDGGRQRPTRPSDSPARSGPFSVRFCSTDLSVCVRPETGGQWTAAPCIYQNYPTAVSELRIKSETRSSLSPYRSFVLPTSLSYSPQSPPPPSSMSLRQSSGRCSNVQLSSVASPGVATHLLLRSISDHDSLVNSAHFTRVTR